jgi:integrase
MRAVNRLTARYVATATREGYHADGAGLYLQVTSSGAKSWIFRYTLRKKPHEMGLGPITAVSLASAREKRDEYRRLLASGVDPLEARGRAREASEALFGAVAKEYIEANRPGWRNAKHAAQWENTLNTYAAPLLGKPVSLIDTEDVLGVLRPIWAKKTETAVRVRQRIEAVLDYATVAKKRTGENPARWRGHLDKILPKPTKVAKVRHHPALPYAKLPAFMRRLRKLPGAGPAALEFTILTAVRTSEAIGATWREFDLDRALWEIPGDRTKSRRPHVVPLSERVVEILRGLKAAKTRHPFEYRGKPVGEGAMASVLRRMRMTHITVHGFRSTFRDWAAECTHHPSDVAEMALGHVIKNKTEAAYRRGALLEKRRALMDDWAAIADGV